MYSTTICGRNATLSKPTQQKKCLAPSTSLTQPCPIAVYAGKQHQQVSTTEHVGVEEAENQASSFLSAAVNKLLHRAASSLTRGTATCITCKGQGSCTCPLCKGAGLTDKDHSRMNMMRHTAQKLKQVLHVERSGSADWLTSNRWVLGICLYLCLPVCKPVRTRLAVCRIKLNTAGPRQLANQQSSRVEGGSFRQRSSPHWAAKLCHCPSHVHNKHGATWTPQNALPGCYIPPGSSTPHTVSQNTSLPHVSTARHKSISCSGRLMLLLLLLPGADVAMVQG